MPCWILKAQIEKTDTELENNYSKVPTQKQEKSPRYVVHIDNPSTQKKGTQEFKVIIDKQEV